jgi:hypothetical protein
LQTHCVAHQDQLNTQKDGAGKEHGQIHCVKRQHQLKTRAKGWEVAGFKDTV